jgi:hypothetical protein
MPLITTADLGTNIYPEIITEITRSDAAISDKAIATAIQETKMYLGRYDLVQLFGTETAAPTIADEYLKSLVKDIACWHLLRLSNTGIDYSAARVAYQDAISSLKNIMSGQAKPEGWPYLDTSATALPADGNAITWNSNPKRSNYY